MDLLYKMLGEIVVVASAQAASHLFNRAVLVIRNWGHNSSANEIREFLEQVGHATDAQIRSLVDTWLKEHPDARLDATKREELIALLVNLARGARIQNTQGVVRSNFVRNVRVLEQLLSDLRPERSKGDKVAADHDWVLQQFLGMGTFGEVWKATNPHFPEPRAFKFFTRGEALRMIRAEAATLSHVHTLLGHHPNIVAYHDVAVNHPSNPYIALEYVGGGSLEEWIVEDENERVALDRTELMRGLVDAVATAHEKGIYHRDLKPANVVLTDELRPRAKITDFGLGHVASQATSMGSAQLSQSAVVGTSMYLPPEAQSVGTAQAPAAQDVFAIGVIWYQVLAGRIERPPYDFAEELRHSGVDSHTIRLISHCLARPKHRFGDATALHRAMEELPPDPWAVPTSLFDVSHLFREYHARQVS